MGPGGGAAWTAEERELAKGFVAQYKGIRLIVQHGCSTGSVGCAGWTRAATYRLDDAVGGGADGLTLEFTGDYASRSVQLVRIN
jgi:hypothetical protein